MKQYTTSINGMRDLHLHVSRMYACAFRQAGITLPQYVLLNQLVELGPMSFTELAKRLYISKPCLTPMIKRLIRHDWIRKENSRTDKRSYFIQVTPKGKSAVKRIQNQVFQFRIRVLNDMSVRERKVILKYQQNLSLRVAKALQSRNYFKFR
ncbi:MAG: hypothetical protein COV74_08730 [Candidatus Omnitrophica bacterium CG11_big_fil_rev_8_21_14_0_20_45_26]|uniref:HTH marR-type domain-containing protein n=1 Tax=Candidatus Abzuiibacterium crystallinum TaxID=1974748 RepID=A0A2H0LPE7_9BACT|nr:MAG: hypothetical protein COV74_08730 [Candidatus Omnitrophica bacterium CG11_big_fil_rev_8_21_14_0_20_45_26]PIW63745.1 MAG: hypothetical protein COW12_09615 [Candidatus Omnitrophica bacterium CG12_big_fil_rev_8_21_14_0_65_45_16]